VKDRQVDVPVLASDESYRGRVWGIIRDEIELNGQRIVRDFLQHMGAVAVVAINEHEEVLVITQYRHPVGSVMVEIPAGLLDIADELPSTAAARELLEESGYSAGKYETLVDLCTTPGSSSESIRIYLATDLTRHSWDAAELDAEERDIQVAWVSVQEAIDHIIAGEWQSPTAAMGILAYAARGSRPLRDKDAEWPMRAHALNTHRSSSWTLTSQKYHGRRPTIH